MATEVQSSAPASTPAEDDETWLYGGKNMFFFKQYTHFVISNESNIIV